MTPADLHTRLRGIHESLELLIADKSAMPDWPLITARMVALSDGLEKAAGTAPMAYAAFLQHCAIVLTGGIQAMQLTGNSDDEPEMVNVWVVIAVAVAGLMRTAKTRFICDGNPAND